MHRNLSIALRIAGKELRSALRDRQTVLYSLVLPLVLYPGILWILLQGATLLRGRDEITVTRVLIVGEPESVSLQRLDEALREPATDDLAPGPIETDYPREELSPERIEVWLRNPGRGYDLALHFPEAAGEGRVELLYEGTRSGSNLARQRVVQRLEHLARELRSEEIERSGGDPEGLTPFTVSSRSLASRRDLGAYIFSFILPMTFVLMAVMGAFYPAVDSTAGEKERGTAETTLLAPIPREALLLGKVVAVAASALGATVLNLLGLALAADSLLTEARGLSIEVPWLAFVAVAPLCLVFLVAISAILVAIASFTRTFKQGQALLGVVQLCFFLPAVFAVMPGVELTPLLAIVPVVQTVLAFKTILQSVGASQNVAALELVLVFLSQLVYAWAALRLSLYLTTRESTLVSGPSQRLSSLLARLRPRRGSAPEGP